MLIHLTAILASKRWQPDRAARRAALAAFRADIDGKVSDERVMQALEDVRHYWFHCDAQRQRKRKGGVAVDQVLSQLAEPYRLMASTIYGAGLRLRECLGLRVQDLDFSNHSIVVRSGKGEKDRLTVFPASLMERLERHLTDVRLQFDADRRDRRPGVPLPKALGLKFPRAGEEWVWYWVFPARGFSANPQTNRRGVMSPLDRGHALGCSPGSASN
jgi:integrase